MDYAVAKAATHPYQRRRDVLAQEQAEHTAAAQVAAPRPETAVSRPYAMSPLKTCVCGARPRYGFDVHVQHCAAAIKAARQAEPVAPVAVVWAEPPAKTFETFGDVVIAVNGDDLPRIIPPAAPVKLAGKGECPTCGKHFPRGLHFHAPRCRGKP